MNHETTAVRPSRSSRSRGSSIARVAATLLLPVITGCGGSGGGGGMPNFNPGTSLGSLIGGKTGQAFDVGAKGAAALTMSQADEDEMGRAVAIAATNQWPLYDNPALNKYVTMVGLTLADASSNPTGNWVFGVLDTPELGAYSGPNGYVMVTRGAIAAMQDESELAGVLAHEMSHVINHDGFEAVKRAKLGESVVQGVSMADQKLAVFSKSSDFLVNTVLRSGWSQSQETAADAGAVKLLQAAGYDPTGLARFLKRLPNASSKPFGTHPGTADRVTRITQQAGPAKGATNTPRFTKAKTDAKL